MITYPLAKLVQVPKTPYVPSWATDANSIRETFKRARRSVGKQTRVRVETLHVAQIKLAKKFVKFSPETVDTESA
jgi:hypothetical protein